MRGRERIAVVGLMMPGGLQIEGIDAADHVGGDVEFISGKSAGLHRRIISREEKMLLLNEPAVFSSGDRVKLREGCDKRFATCVERFANAKNFRGEPHVPGADLLLRYGV
jgi:uncharacterized phage protein (TIGR02218 family)